MTVAVHVWNEDAPAIDDVRIAGWLDAVALCTALPIPPCHVRLDFA